MDTRRGGPYPWEMLGTLVQRCASLGRLTVGSIACLSIGLVAGCSPRSVGDGAMPTDAVAEQMACTPGRATACACSDGSMGAQVCEAGGTLGACRCDAIPEAGPADAVDDGTSDARFLDVDEDGALDASGDADPTVGDASDGGGDTAETCVPVGCEAFPDTCGHIADGCGGLVNCGTCAPAVVTEVPFSVNDVVADPTRNVLYLSVPASDPMYGNRLVVFDPVTLTVVDSFFIGSDPGSLAMSDDARELYVSLVGENAIRRVDLATRAPDMPFVLPPNPTDGYPEHARDMVVMPGHSRRLVASLHIMGYSPSFAGLVVFDDGVPLPSRSPWTMQSNRVVQGNANAVFAYDGTNTAWGFYETLIDDTGAHAGRDASGIVMGIDGLIASADGFIYSSHGELIDEATLTVIGMFPTTGYPVPDRSRGRIYFVRASLFGGSGPTSITVCDDATQRRLETIDLGTLNGSVDRGVRFAPNGIALHMANPFGYSRLQLVRSGLITRSTP